MHTKSTQAAAAFDLIRVEALAGLQLYCRAATGEKQHREVDRMVGEIVRLVVRGRTRLLVLEGGRKRKAAPAGTEAA